jgi:hypothetical protein
MSGSLSSKGGVPSIRDPGGRQPSRGRDRGALLAGEDVGDQIAAAAYADLVEDRLRVVFDGVGRQVQFGRDRLGGAPRSTSSATSPRPLATPRAK